MTRIEAAGAIVLGKLNMHEKLGGQRTLFQTQAQKTRNTRLCESGPSLLLLSLVLTASTNRRRASFVRLTAPVLRIIFSYVFGFARIIRSDTVHLMHPLI